MSRELNNWDVFWTNQVHMGQNVVVVASGRRDAIKSLVSFRDL